MEESRQLAHRIVVDPVGKVRQTQSDRWKKRPCVERYRAFADVCRACWPTLQDGDTVVFLLPMPASWSRKKRAEHSGQPHRGKPDLDNLLGALMDALMPQGDSHLARLGGLSKLWHPSGEIQIWR